MVTELECWRMSRASFDDIEGAGVHWIALPPTTPSLSPAVCATATFLARTRGGVLDTGLGGSGGDFEQSEGEEGEGARSPPRARAKKVAVAQTTGGGGREGGRGGGGKEQTNGHVGATGHVGVGLRRRCRQQCSSYKQTDADPLMGNARAS
jgi:hypothetical protein